jgi:ATP-binding cassette subfamily B protein
MNNASLRADKQDPGIERETLRLFWKATLQVPRRLLWGSLFFPIGAIFLGTIAPLFIGKIFASLSTQSDELNKYLVYFCIAAFIGFLGNRYGFQAYLHYQAQAMRILHGQGLDMLLRRSVGFHNNNVGGKLVSDASDYPSGFSQLTNGLYAQLIPFVSVMVTGIIVVFIESWILGLVILLTTLITVGTGILESRRRSNLRRERLIATKDLTAHLADTIVNVQTVKTFAREHDESREHYRLSGILRDMRLSDWGKAATKGSNRVGMLLIMQAVFIVVAYKLVQNDPALLGVGIFAFTFTMTLSNRLFDINTMLRSIEDGFLLASPMTEYLMQDTEVKDKPRAKPLKATKGAITLKDVSFQYQNDHSEQTVFDHLSLTVKPGEKIGLVGPSGGGKSTLTRLLLRFEDIDSGTITIDGQAIDAVTQESLRRAISYVPQEPLMFHRSVRDNIAYGNPAATDEAIIQAARAAHAHEFIEALSDGYDTIVGERGVKLSGGQRQRVAIARAVLKNAPILILDEATSALDSESEVLIQDALWQLMQKRTAIVIAHRLSTIQKMDRILVLEDGTITEQGTHKQLLAKKGTYARLWGHQSGGFIDD